jgi:GNAT superfamily N-acetyltransferase
MSRAGDGVRVDPVQIRPAGADDEAAVLSLLSETLGWTIDDRHAALFRWKHRDSPFGHSPAWVALDCDGIVGFRTFMRWRFVCSSEPIDVVRAVDTAISPRARGRGIFRALTLHGVAHLAGEGVAWSFNTPNSQSMPGYLSMGWQQVGRLPAVFRPAGLAALPRLARARCAADLWSVPTSAGEDAAEVLGDGGNLAGLVADRGPTGDAMCTQRTPAYLVWRYCRGPLGYRVLLAGSSVEDGVAVFRLRRRGPALEAVVCDVLVPGGDRRLAVKLVQKILGASKADHLLAVGRRPPGWAPVPGGGPLLTWRALAVAELPTLARWDLNAGDVEVF